MVTAGKFTSSVTNAAREEYPTVVPSLHRSVCDWTTRDTDSSKAAKARNRHDVACIVATLLSNLNEAGVHLLEFLVQVVLGDQRLEKSSLINANPLGSFELTDLVH